MGTMCGRFAVTTDPALLAEKIKAIDEATSQVKDAPSPNYSANYNVAPTTTVATVVKRHTDPDDESTRRVRLMRWGLVPPWVKATDTGTPETKGPLLINARSDKVTSSPAFRSSAKAKRCLVPMDGWYEWQGAKGAKTPFYMHATDGESLFMAGLWSSWRPKDAPKDAPPLLSCTIITTEDWDHWLDPDAPIDEGLLRGHGDLDRIAIREVSRLVNSVRNNGPELIEPVEPQAEQGMLL